MNKNRFIGSVISMAIFLALVFSGSAAYSQTLDSEQWAFLNLINTYRAQNGAGALQVSAALQSSSQWMSTDMATKNYFSHTDSLGRDPFTRIQQFGYPYYPAGENIAAGTGTSTAQVALNQWINACDPDTSGACTYAHRQNMLNGSYKVIGIGRAYNASATYGWYWTTDFGGVVDTVINPPSETTPPSTPTLSSATVQNGNQVKLVWTASSDNVGVTGYQVFRNGSSVASVAGNILTYTDTGLALATTYTYTVKAFDAAGNLSAASNSIQATTLTPTVTLNASAASVTAGGSLSISWTINSGATATDWVGLFPVGAANTAYVWWQYTNGTSSGTINLTAPTQAGSYEFRYLLQNGFSSAAKSASITVTNPSYSLSPSVSTLTAGSTLSISWTAPPGASTTDWIGLYPIAAANTGFVWWQYTGGALSGSFNVTAPSASGQYQFRYLLQNGYTDVLRSSTVTVTGGGPAISAVRTNNTRSVGTTVTWTTDATADSQVEYGSTVSYGSSSVLNATLVNAHSVSLTGLVASTPYHYRVKSRSGSGVLTTSGDFTFTTPTTAATGYTMTPGATTVAVGGALSISWTAPAGSSTTDWISIFPVGAPNSGYGSWKYTNGAASGTLSLTAPTQAGQYEVRYLLQDGFNDVLRTGVITVQ